MDPAGLPALLDAIRHMHGCEALHVESVPVRETLQGKVVWEGEVQVFDVSGHPTAKRCYAWSHATGGSRRRFMVVLHAPPVESPVAARTRIHRGRRQETVRAGQPPRLPPATFVGE